MTGKLRDDVGWVFVSLQDTGLLLELDSPDVAVRVFEGLSSCVGELVKPVVEDRGKVVAIRAAGPVNELLEERIPLEPVVCEIEASTLPVTSEEKSEAEESVGPFPHLLASSDVKTIRTQAANTCKYAGRNPELLRITRRICLNRAQRTFCWS